MPVPCDAVAVPELEEMREIVRGARGEELLQNREIALFGSCLQAPAHRGVVLAVVGPRDERIERAREEVRAFNAAMDVLLGLDGVEVAPPSVAIAAAIADAAFPSRRAPATAAPLDDQALAIAVEQLVGGGAAQACAHSPDVRLDDAPAERIVEGLKLEFGEEVGGVVGRHQETFVACGFDEQVTDSCRRPAMPPERAAHSVGRDARLSGRALKVSPRTSERRRPARDR